MSGVKRIEFELTELGRVYVLASDYDALANEWRVATGANIMLRKELASMRSERDTLRAEVERLNLHVEKAQQHALTMGNKTIDLAGREIDLHAEIEALREIREIASQCAANSGYLCSRDLIELRELLKK